MDGRSFQYNESELQRRQQLESQQKTQQTLATVGVVGSIAFLVMMMWERPKIAVWFLVVGAIVFIWRRSQQKKLQAELEKVEVNFPAVRSHQISPCLPWLKSEHLGHDSLVTQLIQAMDRDLSLASPSKILGAHLIMGPRGTGKTQLVKLIAKGLFGEKNIIEFDFKGLDQDLFTEKFVEMIARVNQNPYQLILLENMQDIDTFMLDPFLEILKTHQWKTKTDQTPTHFTSCVFIGVATGKSSTGDVEYELIDDRFLSFCNEMISWGELPHSVMAEIAAKQLCQQWKEQNIEIEFIAPRVIFEILKDSRIKSHLGAHHFQHVIRKKSARALDSDCKQRLASAILDVDEQGSFFLAKSQRNRQTRRAS